MEPLKLERVCIIGDIHGMLDDLQILISKINALYPGIKIILIGDLVDRGPKSAQVIQYCINNSLMSIMGNHDFEFLNFLQGKISSDMICHPGMGGLSTQKSYDLYNRCITDKDYREIVPFFHKRYLETMPKYLLIDTPKDKYYLTHAGFQSHSYMIEDCRKQYEKSDEFYTSEQSWEQLSEHRRIKLISELYEDDILWNHKRAGMNRVFGYKQVLGHYPMKEVMNCGNFIMIDTGSGKGGKLSAIVLPEEMVISV